MDDTCHTNFNSKKKKPFLNKHNEDKRQKGVKKTIATMSKNPRNPPIVVLGN